MLMGNWKVITLVYQSKQRFEGTPVFAAWLYYGTPEGAVKNSLYERDDSYRRIAAFAMPLLPFIWSVLIRRNSQITL